MRHVFLKNAMEYVGYLCHFMQRRNLQKLREFAKIARTCKNCGLMNKKRKSDSPNTLFSLGYYLNVKSKHTTESAGNN